MSIVRLVSKYQQSLIWNSAIILCLDWYYRVWMRFLLMKRDLTKAKRSDDLNLILRGSVHPRSALQSAFCVLVLWGVSWWLASKPEWRYNWNFQISVDLHCGRVPQTGRDFRSASNPTKMKMVSLPSYHLELKNAFKRVVLFWALLNALT